MLSTRKNRLSEAYRSDQDPLNSFVQAATILCETCGKTEVPKLTHFRCYSCGKYTCFGCAHYHAVFLKEPLTLRVRSMRLCPNCKITTRQSSDFRGDLSV